MCGSKKKRWIYIALALAVAIQLCLGMSGIPDDFVFADKSAPSKLDTQSGIQASVTECVYGDPKVSETMETGSGMGLMAEYYEKNILEDLVFKRIDNKVDFDWGSSSPDPEIKKETFSVRWTGKVQPQYTDEYTFYTLTNGGVRLWIDGKKIINDWEGNQERENNGKIKLKAKEKYDVVMEYCSYGGGAKVKLYWSSEEQEKEIIPQAQLYSLPEVPSVITAAVTDTEVTLSWQAALGAASYDIEKDGEMISSITDLDYEFTELTPDTQYTYRIRAVNSLGHSEWSEAIVVSTLPEETSQKVAGNGIKGEYYKEKDFTKLLIVRNDDTVNFNWSSSSPDPVIPQDKFAVRWTGMVKAKYTGTYTFYTFTDDGVRLIINGQLLIDGWGKKGERENTAQISLEAGKKYDIVMEYCQNKDLAKAMLYWSSAGQPKQIIPKAQLYRIPDVPENIAAVSTSTKNTFTWDAVTGAEWYEIEADGAVVNTGLDTAYIHTGLLPNTGYTYRVRASNEAGIGEWSKLKTKYTAPDVPGNISATSTSTTISLTWDEVEAAAGYDVEVLGSPKDNGNSTTYTQTNLNPNTQRIYRVRAKNENGIGDWSAIIAKTTLPGIPANINSESAETTIKFTWDATAGATAYDVEADGILFENVMSSEYSVCDISPNTRVNFRVRAKNEDGAGDWSNLVTEYTLPAVPAIISAKVLDNSVKLTWVSVDGAAGYDIEADGLVIGCGANNEYIHQNLLPNTIHTYRVRSKNEYKTGNWSELIKKLTLPDIPKNLVAEATSSSVKLTWDKVDGAIGYEIEADGIILSAGTDTTYLNDNLPSNTEHIYRVRAKSEAGAGNWSGEVKAFTLISIPQNIRTFPGSSSIRLVWDKVDGVTGYEIEADGSLIDVDADSEYIHSGLMPNTTHIYRVRAKSGNSAGDWSKCVIATTLLASISDIEAVSTSTTITFSWTPIGDAESYKVCADGRTITGILEPVYTVEGLKPNTPHTFKVIANSETNRSDWSKLITKYTAPDIPQNIMAVPTSSTITVSWDAVNGATSYDIEVDEIIIDNGINITYLHEKLSPNAKHVYRVRARNKYEAGEWSQEIIGITVPELTFNCAEDNLFNFVIAAPKLEAATSRTIIVTYNPEEVEAIDLCAATSKKDIEAGGIEGSNLEVKQFTPGTIVFSLKDSNKAIMNAIKFKAKINGQSKIMYVIE